MSVFWLTVNVLFFRYSQGACKSSLSGVHQWQTSHSYEFNTGQYNLLIALIINKACLAKTPQVTTDKLQDSPFNYLCRKWEFDIWSRFTEALFYCTHLMVYSRHEHWLLIMAYIYYCSCTVGNSNWLCEVAWKRR